MCTKIIFENRLTNKTFMCKNILPEREVTIFQENFKSLNILSILFEINIMCPKTLI